MGSANMSNSCCGLDLLDEPFFRALIASSCERVGRCEGGPRGGAFSSRELEYGGGIALEVFDLGGGGRMVFLLDLSLRVRLS